MSINKADWYEEYAQRSGSVAGWLDETLEDVLGVLASAVNEGDSLKKDQILLSLMSYLDGLQDGNRFGKSSPYTSKCPPLPKGGSRILFAKD